MDEDFSARQFESHRPHLRAVAYRMLGSLSEADDAVQEAWIRFDRADTSGVENMPGWLTTVVGRICLDKLRTRTSRREEPLDVFVPDPIVSRAAAVDPEHEALLTDSVGMALLVVLQELAPPERLAFVLHDMFSVSFDDIAPIVDRTPAATRKLASRARRRVHGATPVPEKDLTRQQEVVDAFLAASRAGDFDSLVAVLDPDIVLRVDYGAGGVSTLIRGADSVAKQALMFSRYAPFARRVLVNGAPGTVTSIEGRPFSVVAFTVVGGRIAEIDIIADRDRLAALDLGHPTE